MKQLITILVFAPLCLFAQKKDKMDAAIRKVTVFTSGAQVEHQHTVSLTNGKQTIVFQKLTDFVDPNSIQLKASQNATILSIRTRKNFDETAIAKKDMDSLNARRKHLEAEEQTFRTEYEVLLLDEQLLLRNNDLSTPQQAVKIAELKEASTFFHSKLTEIQSRKSLLEEQIESIIRSINEIEQEINTRRSLPVKNYTEIEVELEVTTAGNTEFTFSYITPNASWKPYYDMRSNGIGAPVLLEAKGLVTQNTGISWDQVQLVLSTNDPYDNTQEAEIQPWHLNYNTPAPHRPVIPRQPVTYNYTGETVYGEVIDAVSGEPLAFAKIQLSSHSNTIVSTDAAGRFSFVVPRGETGYTVSYLGYSARYENIRAPFTKIMLIPEAIQMEQLTTYGYSQATANSYGAVSINSESLQLVPGVAAEISLSKRDNRRMRNAAKVYETEKVAEEISIKPIAVAEQKDLRMEFVINTPFNIPSDNADHRVAIAVYQMDAAYEYHAVPKLDPSVYLVAQISGWEKLNLLSGESNIYFDGTFIGKSYVDVQSTKDTLSFSLGKDRKVIVERKRSEENSKTKVIGNRKRYDVQWDFAIRNNGGAAIPFIMKDHFPISVNEDIKVKQGEYAGAVLEEKTGILTWRSVLNKGEIKNYQFGYSVEYSGNMPIYLE